MQKYTNVRTMARGIEFDSRLEARRYIYLKNWESRGLISDLECQVKFKLEEDGVVSPWAKRKYIADFCYTQNGKTVVEDVKSSWTARDEVFRAKKQRMRELGVHVKEVLPTYVPFLDLPESIKYKQTVISKKLSKDCKL